MGSLATTPNPFRTTTAIRFDLVDLGADAPVFVTLHDVTGGTVRSLAEGRVFAAGSHAVEWNGRDDAGRDVPPGVYFVRVRTPDEEFRGRVSLLR